MKVLLITTEFPPNIFGGGGTFMYNLARGLAKQGIETFVLTRNVERNSLRIIRKDRIKVIRIPTANVPPRHVWFQLHSKALLHKLIQEFKPDVVHANSFSANIIFRCLVKEFPKIPRVITVHGDPNHELYLSMKSIKYGLNFGQISTYLLGYPSWEYILKSEIKYSNRVVAVSDFLRYAIIANYGVNDEKVVCIPIGIDVDFVLEKTQSCNVCEKEGEYLLVSGGRLYYEKGHILLIYIMKKLIDKGIRDVKLLIAGDGPLRPLLEKKIRQLGLNKNVELLGWLTYENVLCTLHVADIVIVPSLYETFSIFLIESIILGKPVIALDAPYLEEHIKRGLFIEKFRTINEATEKLIKMLNKIDEYNALMKEIALIARKKYSVNVMTGQYIELYNDLLKA